MAAWVRQVVLRDRPERQNGFADLLDVLGASVAERQVVVETLPKFGWHGAFEVLGDDLDEFGARQRSRVHCLTWFCAGSPK